MRLASILLAVSVGFACGHPARVMPFPFRDSVATASGWKGWYQLSQARLPEPLAVSSPLGSQSPDCRELRSHLDTERDYFVVLVHGVYGFGPEWKPVYAALAKMRLQGLFEFRWAPGQSHDELLWKLSTGISRLLQCAGRDNIKVLVIAHSAGGVLSSFAASRISVPRSTPSAQVEVLTIASPLAGLVSRERSFDDSTNFFDELGTALADYPAPALSVNVTHLRTQAPGDTVMSPAPDGHRPNDCSALVPTARALTLPPDVGHDESLALAAQHLAAGDFEQWAGTLEAGCR